MSRADSMTIHRARCRDPYCPSCERRAEELAADLEPDYDTSGAADQYERWLGL